MGGPAVSERVLVLGLSPSGESFSKLNALSAESGAFVCLRRVSKKNPLHAAPDLFDTADVSLETSKQGGLRFVGEYRLVHRRSEIGHSYRTLQAASNFCALINLNGLHMEDTAALFQLTKRTLDAFTERNVPAVVLLKGIYLLLKDEGYPVRESWWPQVPVALRENARNLLNRPTPERADAALLADAERITQNLCRWLRRETDLLLPDSLKF